MKIVYKYLIFHLLTPKVGSNPIASLVCGLPHADPISKFGPLQMLQKIGPKAQLQGDAKGSDCRKRPTDRFDTARDNVMNRLRHLRQSRSEKKYVYIVTDLVTL